MNVFEEGDVVTVVKRPVGCCGVLKQGWFGVVQSVIDLHHTGTGEDLQIVILDDNSLAWSSECELRSSVGGIS